MENGNAELMKALLTQSGAAGATPVALDKLAKAYVAAWGEVGVGVGKDANNPHFGNDYATLEAHLDVVKPIFARHGLALLQSPGRIVDGSQEIITLILHESGQHLSITTHIPLGGKLTAQASGSATTYGRRYVVGGVGGLAPVDDDGEGASAQSTPLKQTKKADKPKDTAASYAETTGALIAEIEAFAGSVDELEKTIRPRVEDMGDAKVNEVYVARRRALKGKK